jgi:hypothetical protein
MHTIGDYGIIHMNVYPSYIPRNHPFHLVKKMGIGQIMYSNANMLTTIEYKMNFFGNKLKIYFS